MLPKIETILFIAMAMAAGVAGFLCSRHFAWGARRRLARHWTPAQLQARAVAMGILVCGTVLTMLPSVPFPTLHVAAAAALVWVARTRLQAAPEVILWWLVAMIFDFLARGYLSLEVSFR